MYNIGLYLVSWDFFAIGYNSFRKLYFFIVNLYFNDQIKPTTQEERLYFQIQEAKRRIKYLLAKRNITIREIDKRRVDLEMKGLEVQIQSLEDHLKNASKPNTYQKNLIEQTKSDLLEIDLLLQNKSCSEKQKAYLKEALVNKKLDFDILVSNFALKAYQTQANASYNTFGETKQQLLVALEDKISNLLDFKNSLLNNLTISESTRLKKLDSIHRLLDLYLAKKQELINVPYQHYGMNNQSQAEFNQQQISPSVANKEQTPTITQYDQTLGANIQNQQQDIGNETLNDTTAQTELEFEDENSTDVEDKKKKLLVSEEGSSQKIANNNPYLNHFNSSYNYQNQTSFFQNSKLNEPNIFPPKQQQFEKPAPVQIVKQPEIQKVYIQAEPKELSQDEIATKLVAFKPTASFLFDQVINKLNEQEKLELIAKLPVDLVKSTFNLSDLTTLDTSDLSLIANNVSEEQIKTILENVPRNLLQTVLETAQNDLGLATKEFKLEEYITNASSTQIKKLLANIPLEIINSTLNTEFKPASDSEDDIKEWVDSASNDQISSLIKAIPIEKIKTQLNLDALEEFDIKKWIENASSEQIQLVASNLPSETLDLAEIAQYKTQDELKEFLTRVDESLIKNVFADFFSGEEVPVVLVKEVPLEQEVIYKEKEVYKPVFIPIEQEGGIDYKSLERIVKAEKLLEEEIEDEEVDHEENIASFSQDKADERGVFNKQKVDKDEEVIINQQQDMNLSEIHQTQPIEKEQINFFDNDDYDLSALND